MLESNQRYDLSPGETPENSINMWLVICGGVICVTTDTSAGCFELEVKAVTRGSVLLFSKLNQIFFGYFDPEKIFLDNKNK